MRLQKLSNIRDRGLDALAARPEKTGTDTSPNGI